MAEEPSPGLLTPIFNPLQSALLYQTLSLGLGFSAFDLLIGLHPLRFLLRCFHTQIHSFTA